MPTIETTCIEWAALARTYKTHDDFLDDRRGLDSDALVALRRYKIFEDMHDVLINYVPVNGETPVCKNEKQELIDTEIRGTIIYNNLINAWNSLEESTQFEVMMLTGTDYGAHFSDMLKQFKYQMSDLENASKDFYEAA